MAKANPIPARRPSVDTVDRLLQRHGARLAAGPWEELTGERWSVPAMTYMGSRVCVPELVTEHVLPNFVIAPGVEPHKPGHPPPKDWRVEREAIGKQPRQLEYDPVAGRAS